MRTGSVRRRPELHKRCGRRRGCRRRRRRGARGRAGAEAARPQPDGAWPWSEMGGEPEGAQQVEWWRQAAWRLRPSPAPSSTFRQLRRSYRRHRGGTRRRWVRPRSVAHGCHVDLAHGGSKCWRPGARPCGVPAAVKMLQHAGEDRRGRRHARTMASFLVKKCR
jgi:hypothetical protein